MDFFVGGKGSYPESWEPEMEILVEPEMGILVIGDDDGLIIDHSDDVEVHDGGDGIQQEDV